MIGSAEIGEIMMRAFILRRVGLIDEGRRRLDADRHAGHAGSRAASRVFSRRNGYPYTVLDPARTRTAAAVIERAGVSATSCR